MYLFAPCSCFGYCQRACDFATIRVLVQNYSESRSCERIVHSTTTVRGFVDVSYGLNHVNTAGMSELWSTRVIKHNENSL